MKLSFEQIKGIVQGAVYVDMNGACMQFHRFTKEQEEVYDVSQYHPKQYATAGVRLWFMTDSKSLDMKVVISKGSSRKFWAHDVVVNGTMIGSFQNETEEDIFGEFEKHFDLGEGEKSVCIYMPWSACSMLKEMILDDGSYVKPVKKDKKVLIYGDSITQGYDALNPINRYAGNLANALDAEEINKAIGGEKFCPWLAEAKEDFEPDYISVAYGTNHWHRATSEQFREICDEFYGNLVKNYPNAKIYALTPIWRKDRTDQTGFRDFEEIGEIIAGVVKKYDNIECISCRDFVPEDETLFSDLYLHPNDAGFEYYSEGVKKAILM